MEESDKKLIVRYLNGQVDALETLVQRYKRPLFGYILGMTGIQTDADEIFQDVWLRAIKKLSAFRHKNLSGWLMRIAHNLVIDRARKRKPDLLLDQEGAEGGTLKDIIPGKSSDPGRELEAAELGEIISRALDQLPVEQREVFVMRTQLGLAFKEIAGMQRVSINTALARMQYALAGLKPLLKEVYDEL